MQFKSKKILQSSDLPIYVTGLFPWFKVKHKIVIKDTNWKKLRYLVLFVTFLGSEEWIMRLIKCIGPMQFFLIF